MRDQENIDYKRKIKASGLTFKIKKISTLIFQEWVQHAKAMYKLPDDYDIQASPEELQEKLIENLITAIKSLLSINTLHKFTPGWSFGYICGHMQGQLNLIWSNKYIIERSKEFEDLMKIKSVIELTELDRYYAKKLMIIYDYLMNNRTEKAKTINQLSNNVISIHDTKNKKTIVTIYLIDLLAKKYNSLLNEYKHMCCPNIDEYFSEQEIKDIAGFEHFA